MSPVLSGHHRALRAAATALVLVLLALGHNERLPGSAAQTIDPAAGRAQAEERAAPDRARALESIARTPLHFERNVGQADASIDFLANGAGYRVALSAGRATVAVGDRTTDAPALIGLVPRGARPMPRGIATDDLPGTVSYYRGNDPTRWHAGVSTHARVTYADVYDGIDLVYYGNQRRLQYDFIVHPGASPSAITMGLEGVDGLNVDDEGRLLMRVGERTLVQDRPFTYQDVDGARREVSSRFVVDGEAVRFEVGDYDLTRPLVIDPVIVYSSWLGGSGEEGILDMEVDSDGNLVVFGFAVDSQPTTPFPTTAGAIKTTRNDNDAFVSKFNASGSTLLFSTLLGGSGDEMTLAYNFIGGLALDASNAIYITGTTRSADFPTTVGAHDTDFNDDDAGATGTADGFYVKLSSTGALQYGTYFGGRRVDEPHGIDVDAAGNVYIVGSTDSDTSLGATGGFAVTAAAYDPTYNGAGDLFLVRFSPSGGLTYASYLGGTSTDAVNASDVKVSRTTANVVYIVSDTSSADFPSTPATRLQAFFAGPDAVLLRMNLSLTGANQLTYGTFFGGNGTDFLTSLAVDETDKVYVAGATNSSTLTFAAAITPAGTPSPSGTDVLVAKFDPSKSGGASFLYGTRLNGFYTDTGTDIAVDDFGRAWVGVDSSSFQATPTATDFPLKDSLTTTRSGNGVHQAVFQLNANGSALVISSLIGGNSGRGGPVALALTSVGDLWVGATSGGGTSQLPLVAPFQATYGGGDADATLQRIGGSADLTINKTASPALPTTVLPGQTLTYTIVVTNPSSDTAFDVLVTDTLPIQVTFQSCSATGGGFCGGTGNARTVAFNAIDAGASRTITIVTRVNDDVGPGVTWTNTATVSAGTTDPNPGNNTGGAGSGQPAITDPTADADGDGLPNGWEQQYGLNPLSNSVDNGPNGDPDGDGKTNLQELAEGTHPRGFVITFLAEGATGAFFDTRLAIANPSTSPALVLTRFQRGDGTTIRDYRVVPARSRTTIDVEGIAGLEAAEFSTLIEADVQVVADRTMTWDQNGYGSHAERGILTRTATTWYFAEGATFGNFNLFYLIQNPNDQDAQVQVTYLLPPPAAPLVKTYVVPRQSRFNIWVDAEGANDPALAALANAELSAIVSSTNGVPIIVERAMYLDQPGRAFGAGHESAGVTTPATQWFLAEGATGSYFDLFVLIANPNPTAATVQAEYLLDTGQVITRQYSVAGNSRFNIWVDLEDPVLENAALSTRITSLNGVPLIVERSMWWPGPTSASWQEAHNSPGETATGTRWALAEGETGGPRETETYVLIANTSPFPGTARVTVLFEDGTAPVTRDFPLLANSRSNVAPAGDFPETIGKRFGMLVESVGATPAQIVVERAMYSNAQGVRWAAGTNALATRLP